MGKFNVGDKVIRITNLDRFESGKIYTVTSLSLGGKWLEIHGMDMGRSHPFHEQYFELVKEKEKLWIVGSKVFNTLNAAKDFVTNFVGQTIQEVEVTAQYTPETISTVTWTKKEL